MRAQGLLKRAAKVLPGKTVDRLHALSDALPRRVESIDGQVPLPDGAVDVTALLERLTIDQLVATADAYFSSNLDGVDHWHAKPFWHASEVADMTITFGQVLSALRLAPGMGVLDFGAGPGWTSRYLTQLGCEVLVSDVSVTALQVAKQLYQRNPVVGASLSRCLLVSMDVAWRYRTPPLIECCASMRSTTPRTQSES